MLQAMTANYGMCTATDWLKAKYSMDFFPKLLPLATSIDGAIAFHKFDLVSPDNQIVAKVKAHTMTASGNVPSAKIIDTYVACGMLENVTAKKKLLILTDNGFYKSFLNNSNGRISRKIKIVCPADKHPAERASLLLTHS